ncbi:ensconsin-like isoform X1 [Leucoraja erinacea]|uniref:ensconsin-like isoform X1 n=1 Tax=Leucoraja erinaceus TaxID=7782 RepID=UPI0024574B35|nr:ensconsin-like isoform X1 [Leucoraja erinacea]
MPGSTTVGKQRLKKTSAKSKLHGLFTIDEEDELCRIRNSRTEEALEAQVKGEDKKSSHLTSTFGQSVNSGPKQDHPVLRVDDKQRLAKERREERQKQLAAREQLLLEKEQKARHHYEKQLEERKKKIEEQRLKEERRRTAVDEKRKQRLQEERERHEAVVRRTIERSQRIKQKSNRWSWGATLQGTATINRDGDFVESSSSYLDLAGLDCHSRKMGGTPEDDADRRSVSTMNLTKHADPVINKRLSSSSATLLNSPDKAIKQRISSFNKQPCKPRSTTPEKFSSDSKQARRLQLSAWESSIVTRLLTPTHSFLARSRSTAALYGGGLDAVIPICPRSVSASSLTPPTCKNLHSRMSDWPRYIVTTHDMHGRSRSANPAKMDKREKERENEREKNAVVALTTNSTGRKSYSPMTGKNKSPMPSAVRLSSKTSSAANPKLLISPPGSVKNSSILRPPSPGNVRPTKASECEIKEQEEASSKTQDNTESIPVTVRATPGKVSAGTTDSAEATRLLTENRRIAREQRDREEEEKKEQEERERQMKEEMLRRKGEEKVRREEEARKLGEEKTLQEQQQKVEEERRLLEEKAQRDRDERERLQKQKEEDDRAREEGEKLRKEREEHFQKEEQERMERKKRLEQIMKRTRGSNTPEKADNQLSTEKGNGEDHKQATPDEETSQNPDFITETKVTTTIPDEVTNKESVIQEMSNDGEFAVHSQTDIQCPSAQNIIRENGVSTEDESFEDYIDLAFGMSTRVATETINDDCKDEVGIPVNPVIAFEENGSMELLTKVDGIQTQQTAEVI